MEREPTASASVSGERTLIHKHLWRKTIVHVPRREHSFVIALGSQLAALTMKAARIPTRVTGTSVKQPGRRLHPAQYVPFHVVCKNVSNIPDDVQILSDLFLFLRLGFDE